MGAAPSGRPGWPELAFCTVSIASARIVLIESWSREVALAVVIVWLLRRLVVWRVRRTRSAASRPPPGRARCEAGHRVRDTRWCGSTRRPGGRAAGRRDADAGAGLAVLDADVLVVERAGNRELVEKHWPAGSSPGRRSRGRERPPDRRGRDPPSPAARRRSACSCRGRSGLRRARRLCRTARSRSAAARRCAPKTRSSSRAAQRAARWSCGRRKNTGRTVQLVSNVMLRAPAGSPLPRVDDLVGPEPLWASPPACAERTPMRMKPPRFASA